MGNKGHHNLNLDERLVIEKMLKEGCKTGTIAATLHRSHSCIKQEIRKMGGRSKYDGKKSQERADENNRAKIRHLHKGLTESQTRKIEEMVASGDSIGRIAKNLKITRYRVTNYIHEKKISYKKKSYAHFIERIENLEEQCEILFELIKEKK